MKIIHTADLHIGSKFLKIGDDDKQKELIASLNNSFKNMIDYATCNNISIVLLCGDIFDKDKVNKKDKEYFYSIIRGNPKISFYYIRGNHDINSDYEEDLSNLFLFNNEKLTKPYKDDVNKITISGYEINENNKNLLYDMTPLTSDYYNIMLLHGDIFSKRGKDSINIDKLKKKNINYFALGHIHQRSSENLELNSKYAYPGCMCGRGFDEIGDKGFLVLDTETGDMQFVKNNNYYFEKKEYDVSKFDTLYKLINQIESDITNNEKELLQIVFTNRLAYPLDDSLIIDAISKKVYFLELKNNTKKALEDIEHFDPQSLKGTFVNLLKDDTICDLETKEEIISYGLSKIIRKE